MDKFRATQFEKLLAAVSPGLAIRRMTGRANFEMMAGGAYSATSGSRFRTMQAFGRSRSGSEEAAVSSYDRVRLMLEGADLYRNNSVVAGAINRFADYAVCFGLPPTALTSDRNWNRLAEAWWNDVYANTADFRQQSDLYDLQKMTLTSRLWAGGCGYILLSSGQIEPVEYERIQTPNEYKSDALVTQGVRRSGQGIVVGFYICNRKGGGSVDTGSYRYVKAENFIHCYKPWRFDQLLGVPDIAPLIETVRDHDETSNYILNKIKNEAMRLVKYGRKEAGGAGNAGFRGFTKTDDGGNKRDVKKQEWGMEFDMPVGETMDLLEGKTPSSGSIEYLEQTLRIISACFGVPYEFLLLIFKEGSYSTHRAASLHASHAFQISTDWLAKRLLNRLWTWRIAKAIKEGTLPPAPVDAGGVSEWWKVEWIEPYFESLDPDKQAAGDKTNLEIGLQSVSNIVKGQGRRRENVWQEISEELDDAALRVRVHNGKYPESPITIAHFTNAATPGAAAGGGAVVVDDVDRVDTDDKKKKGDE
jgi:capsid protein